MVRTRATRGGRGLLLAGACLAGFVVSGQASDGSTRPPFLVLVNPENPVRELDTSFVARAFLGKTTRWPDGRPIRPVDLRPEETSRSEFSARVLSRPVRAVQTYWQQAIFSGRGVPPPVVASDRAVVEYVLEHPGAIGYVAPDTPVGRARVVRLR